MTANYSKEMIMNLHRFNWYESLTFFAAIAVLVSVVQLTACGQEEGDQPVQSIQAETHGDNSPVIGTVGGDVNIGGDTSIIVAQPKPSQKVFDKLTPKYPALPTKNITKSINNHTTSSGQTMQKKKKSATDQERDKFENYSVTVSATEKLAIPGPPGELNVWIGISSKVPENQPGMVASTKPLEAVGETAKVTPFTLGINVEPEVSKCEKIHPSGSEVSFKLIPFETGTFKVGASVALYNSNDCTGIPVPKSAKSVEVKVSVDEAKVVTDASFDLLRSTWQAFMDFWDKLLILIFALVLYLIRKKLYKLFGFKADE